MKHIEEVKRAAAALKVPLDGLDAAAYARLISAIKHKYVDGRRHGCFLWERLMDFAAVTDERGWSYLKDFIGDRACVLLLDPSETGGAVLPNGEALDRVLGDCYGFEIYVTDWETDYLLCVNHHDGLMGCGKAKTWVEEICLKRD